MTAGYVIHTVGPVYSGKPQDSWLLTQCYLNSLKLASDHNLTSVAFPAISCGVYGYPINEACKIAIDTTCNFLTTNGSLKKVIFILFSFENYNTYMDYLKSR
ncbi:MAG: macro domain-containing protein [Deltaproteobacteria bacterium]|nr:macro domain-containing protein [Deltaproteobacteria bacterium]MDL1989014.1 macro domain-containing protein [Deltaproteobacteria bacterium]